MTAATSSVPLLRGNPLWRVVWGLRSDRRVLRSPLIGLLAILLLLLAVHAATIAWMHRLWAQTAPATAVQRHLYDAAILWHHIGLTAALVLFGLLLLWTWTRSCLAPSLAPTLLSPRHLALVCLAPLGALWTACELMQWVDSVALANRLAGPGESLLWLIRRPGRITFLTDPVSSPIVVLTHNILTGSIALLGYLLFLLWWAWVLVSLAARVRTLGRAVVWLLGVGLATVLAGAALDHIQGVVALMHPVSVWMFPPGTSTQALWRLRLLTPLQHFLFYAGMHLSILFVELGLVGILRGAVDRALERLWRRMADPGAVGVAPSDG